MAPPSSRMNEYFVPRNGIDREVITADICRYLGNDALVRPGNYENPQTHQIEQGYYITAYRNLTSAMIADLKADSERWEAERRQTAQSRGTAPNVEYRSSTTHHTRREMIAEETGGPDDPGETIYQTQLKAGSADVGVLPQTTGGGDAQGENDSAIGSSPEGSGGANQHDFKLLLRKNVKMLMTYAKFIGPGFMISV